MNLTLKHFSITISILLVLVVCYDFFVLNEYHIESSAMIGVCTLLFFNIVRHFSEKIKSMNWLLIVIYSAILSLAMASFCFLLLMSFGIGYTGRIVPWNHIFAVFLNISLMIVTIWEFNRVLNKKR